MANDCSGTCRVVAKSREAVERLERIMNYRDAEFCVSRCREFRPLGKIEEHDGLFRRDFAVDGCWNCERFFSTDEDKANLVGTAYLTNLPNLAKVLDFGCELWSTEPGCGFMEHITLNRYGEYGCEVGDYSETYPDGEDGEPDYDAEPEENYELDGYGEFAEDTEIYGED